MNWDKYDDWKLASPCDDENEIEVFKAEKYEYYTTCYDSIVNFDTDMLKLEKDGEIGDYDTKEEYLEDHADTLADKYSLSISESDAIEDLRQDELDNKHYAEQCRYDEDRGK